MWKKATLALPASALEKMTGGSNAPFSLAVTGQKIAVHNWTHGKTEQSGRYLSPENAVKAVSAKFNDYADPHRPQGVVQAVVFLITSTSGEVFIQQLEAMGGILDYSEVKQALSYATASQRLEAEKMVKMPTIAFPSFATGADLTPSGGRALNNAVNASLEEAGGKMPADPFAVIAKLKAQKAEKAKARAEQAKKLTQSKAEVWAFVGDGLLDEIALTLFDNLPTSENVFSFMLAFVGEDLSGLKMLLQG